MGFERVFRRNEMFKLGLTGGIGSGKTHVANLLASWGATIIDTDLIAHQLTAPGGAAIDAIRASFGSALIDTSGALDRGRMREIVFADAARRTELEGILHPRIAQEVLKQAREATGLYAVFVVPLLIESGRWRDRIDRLCVVDCEEDTQVARVQARSGIPLETIRRIMAAQVTRTDRLAAADDIVSNMASTTLADLEKQVLVLHKAWCNLAESG
jgi:dephospho-CoA kinase